MCKLAVSERRKRTVVVGSNAPVDSKALVDSKATRGFTLVELLVVISIIGILISLLLPAVQAAREASRRTQCMNNLKQLAVAANSHLQAHAFYPTGGWGSGWVGDPNRGFTADQPGGWAYNLLPYLERADVHDLGKGDASLAADGKRMCETPVKVFYCPSRRRPSTYPFASPPSFLVITQPAKAARNDYAGNAGSDASTLNPQVGPATAADADVDTYTFNYDDLNGVIFQRSQVRAAMMEDGPGHTYLCGEKYVESNAYLAGTSAGDNLVAWVGFDNDVVRSTAPLFKPQSDQATADCSSCFGSPHASSFHVAFCSGTVKAINYSIDATVHQYLGSRNDEQFIDDNKF